MPPIVESRDLRKVFRTVRRRPGALASVEGSTARLRFDRTRERAERLVRRASERYALEDVSIEEPDLESIIRRIYTEGYDRRPEEAST